MTTQIAYCSHCGAATSFVLGNHEKRCPSCHALWQPKVRPTKVYLVGALKNLRIPLLAAKLRGAGFDVFDDWFAAGADADLLWHEYEQKRGRSYREALQAPHARAAFAMDKAALDNTDVVVLVAPAGKSAHLELGYARGIGKRTIVLLDTPNPERWDIMLLFADAVVESLAELVEALRIVRG